MSPDRKCIINQHKIEEFYWAGRFIVYIDNRKTEETYQQACDRIANQSLKSDGQGCAAFNGCNLKEKAGCKDCSWRKLPAI